MKSIWLMARANIKRKKGEAALIGFSILVSVLALEVALGLFSGLHKPFETMIQGADAPHLMVFYDTRTHDTEELRAWFARQEEVVAVGHALPIFQSSRDLAHEGEKLEKSLLLTEYPTAGSEWRECRLQILSAARPIAADKEVGPGQGEIWIPKQMAGANGISLGDKIGIPTSSGLRELEVSALVLDPYFSTSAISPTRCWVASGSLSFLLPMSELTEAGLGVKILNPEAAGDLDQRFKASLQGNFAGWTFHYKMAKLAYGLFLNIISVALLVVAAMALLIAVFIISGAISSAVFSDYKRIGILKSLGFTPGGVHAIYILQYLAIGLAAIPPGIVAGVLITRAIFSSLTNSIGLAPIDFTWILPLAAPLIVVSFIVSAAAWWTSRKASRVKPMEAIRFRTPAPGFSRWSLWSVSLARFLPPSLFMGVRNLSLNAKRTLLAGLGLVMTLCVLVFAVNILATFARISENRALWGGTAADVTVRLTNKRFTIQDHQFLALMQKETGVHSVLPTGSVEGLAPGAGDEGGRQIFGNAYDGDMDEAGLLNLKGRNPRRQDEIALGVNTAKKDGRTIGDSFTLFLEGGLFEFRVCGIYQTAANFGEGFRIQASRLKEMRPDYRASSFAIILEEGVGAATFKERIKQRFAEAVDVRTAADDQRELNGAINGMRLTLILVSLVLLGVSLVAIVNDTLLSIKESQHSLGVLKTLGMTPTQLRLSLAFKALAMSFLSLMVGIPLALLAIPPIMSAIASGIGMVQFPFSIDIIGTALIIPGFLLYVLACAWLPAKAVTRVQTRLLIRE